MPHNLYLHSSLVHERKIDRDNRQSVKVKKLILILGSSFILQH
jgi:Mn2+/Fe2+ NRAMP family transporter